MFTFFAQEWQITTTFLPNDFSVVQNWAKRNINVDGLNPNAKIKAIVIVLLAIQEVHQIFELVRLSVWQRRIIGFAEQFGFIVRHSPTDIQEASISNQLPTSRAFT